MRQQVVGGIVALTLALTPLAVMAQETILDPEVRATVELAAQEVAALLAPAATSTDSGTTFLQPTPEPAVDPPVVDPTEEPTPEPTEESVGTPELLPELNLTDLAEYSSGGVTIQVPVDSFNSVQLYSSSLLLFPMFESKSKYLLLKCIRRGS